MRKSTWRALLILALLVPLSRLSFADDTFEVGGAFGGSGDTTEVSISGPFTFEGSSGTWFDLYGDVWTVGDYADGSFSAGLLDGGNWSFDGFTGLTSYGSFSVVTDPFIVEGYGVGGVPATWTGEIYLSDGFGTTLFEIQMAGVGTASFSGKSVPDGFFVVAGTADVTGVGQVVYEDPSVPEPSTLTLMGIAGIASILAMRFRRPTATQN
jgi:hypothetical protein